jgi:hypothetical protein
MSDNLHWINRQRFLKIRETSPALIIIHPKHPGLQEWETFGDGRLARLLAQPMPAGLCIALGRQTPYVAEKDFISFSVPIGGVTYGIVAPWAAVAAVLPWETGPLNGGTPINHAA